MVLAHRGVFVVDDLGARLFGADGREIETVREVLEK